MTNRLSRGNSYLPQYRDGIHSEDGQDSLPIIDIQEEMDDKGNVINVRFSDSLGNEIDKNGTRQILSSADDADETGNQLQIHKPEDQGSLGDQGEQFLEMLHDLGITPQSIKTEYDDSNSVDTQTSKNEDPGKSQAMMNVVPETEPQSPTGSSRTGPIYELELIASELDENTLSSDGDYTDEQDEFDYDFEDEDGESEELDSSEDEIRYAPLPNDRGLQDRFMQEIENLRRGKKFNSEAAEKIEDKKNTKSVRFSDKLDIKEIEDRGEPLNAKDEKTVRILKFKENRIISQSSHKGIAPLLKNLPDQLASDDRDGPITTDIVENDGIAELDETNRARIEFATNHPEEHLDDFALDDLDKLSDIQKEIDLESTQMGRSRFKKLMAQDPRRNKFGNSSYPTVKISETGTVDSGELNERKNGAVDVMEDSVKRLNIDLPNLQDDMDAMVQAYNVGMYDDDIEVAGPVVDQIEDFEKLNALLELMPTTDDQETSRAQTTSETGDDREVEDLDASESDDEILKDQIVEHDCITDDDDDGDIELDDGGIEGDDIQQSILQQEIADNYHRLRQKLLSKDALAERELEPLEDAPRVSRFKAARTHIL